MLYHNMDGSEVEQELDMKIQQVNDTKLEDSTIPERHSSLHYEAGKKTEGSGPNEHSDTVVKQEPDSDSEMDPQLSHYRDQVPAPFSFVAVKSEIVHEDESWGSTTVKEEVKDVFTTEDYEECPDRELSSQESSDHGSLSAEVDRQNPCYSVSTMSNNCDADRCSQSEINIMTTTGVMLGNVSSNKVRRKKRKNTGEKSYKCDECNRMFARKEHLMRHYRTHTGEKPYKCDICSKLFSQNGTLKGHYRTHTGEKPYSCSICYKRFAENVNLKNHFRIHTEERLHKCDLCSKVFSMRVSLKTHYRSHMGGKTHKCEICRKEFSKGDNLRKHYRTHTGEKPHKCDHCGKEFSVNANLKRHIRTHTGEKPYKCETCNKEYSKSEHLKTHQRIHTIV